MKRGFRGWVVVVAVVLAGTGCAADEVPVRSAGARVTPSDRPCPHGTFRWGKLVKREVLGGVSDAASGCGAGSPSTRPSRRRPSVRSTRALHPYRPRGRWISVLPSKRSRSRPAPNWPMRERADRVQEVSFKQQPGALFYAVGVTTYEASFAYYCAPADTAPVRGTVATWSPVTYGDLVTCGIDEKLAPASREAERLVCPVGPGTGSADSPR